MTPVQFIEKAKQGGFNTEQVVILERILLEPKAWEAVGKVENWNGFTKHKYVELKRNPFYAEETGDAKLLDELGFPPDFNYDYELPSYLQTGGITI